MDSTGKSTGVMSQFSKNSENLNPNLKSPSSKTTSKSPMVKKSAAKTPKSGFKNPNANLVNPVTSPSPKNKIRQRKFVVAKKNSKRDNSSNTSSATAVCKCNNAGGTIQKCLCVAYENLRASQEDFFKKPSGNEEEKNEIGVGEPTNIDPVTQTIQFSTGYENGDNALVTTEDEGLGEIGVSTMKRRRDRMMQVARQSLPESGQVMNLVKAFENILSIPQSDESEEKDDKAEKEKEEAKKGVKWALPGLQNSGINETQVSSSSFCPSDFFLTSESLGLDSRRASSLDSSQGSFSISTRTSGDGRRSRRNSTESAGTLARRNGKKRQPKATSLKPFKLRTEQRGQSKEEEFYKKLQQTAEEEERQRIPVARGLPWTTDEPECLPKPPVKEITRPIDLVLHSDIRAVERADFDHQVTEKLSKFEQYKMERERQQKEAEEEQIRRLRKELVPKAQPMPYFDRPFIPRRSSKNPTIPRDPRFHIPQHKKIKCCCSMSSWSDMYMHEECKEV